MKQLVFIDDSGDPGFVQGVSSKYLVMAGVVFDNLKEATKLNDEISEFRRSFGWRENHEFKFSKTNKQIRTEFLKIVSRYDFDIYIVHIDKASSSDALKTISKERLYNWTTKKLLEIIPLKDAHVKIDGRASKLYKLQVASYLRKGINSNGYKIKKVETQDSVKDNLIQLADMVVGAFSRSLQAEKTDAKIYLKIIKDKIIDIKLIDLGEKENSAKEI